MLLNNQENPMTILQQKPDGYNLHVIRKGQLENVEKSYESSKGKFETCLKDFVKKQQRSKIFYQQMIDAFGNYVHYNRLYS